MGKLGLIEPEDFSEIANAIREKNGETEAYFPSEMPAAIRRIEGGPTYTEGPGIKIENNVISTKLLFEEGPAPTGLFD